MFVYVSLLVIFSTQLALVQNRKGREGKKSIINRDVTRRYRGGRLLSGAHRLLSGVPR